MALPSQGCKGNLGLPVTGPREMGGNNIFVHSVCLPTDETDRGVDQQDGKNHAPSPGCEETDAGREDLLKMRLPTRSDMICGYACLKGIWSTGSLIQTLHSCTFSCMAVWPGRVQGAMKVQFGVSHGLLFSWLQGRLPCVIPNGAPGTSRPSLKCSLSGLVTCTWPICL